MLNDVILDSASSRAFLWLALKEQLIEEVGATDRWKDSILHNEPPLWLVRQVLQQVVLTPSVTLNHSFPSQHLRGYLIDNNIVKAADEDHSNNSEFVTTTLDIIKTMVSLHYRDYDLSVFEISKWKEFTDELQSITSYITDFERRYGRSIPSDLELILEQIFSNLFARSSTKVMGFEQQLAIEDKNKLEEIHLFWKKLSPIHNSIKEYSKLFHWTKANNGLMKVPIYYEDVRILDERMLPRQSGESKEIAIVRITAQRLGGLSYRPTLRESLEMANYPATLSLRHYIPEWINAIANYRLSESEIVEKELKIAKSRQEDIKNRQKSETIVGHLEIPMAMVDMFFPVLWGVGLMASIIGKYREKETQRVQDAYKWTDFGRSIEFSQKF